MKFPGLLLLSLASSVEAFSSPPPSASSGLAKHRDGVAATPAGTPWADVGSHVTRGQHQRVALRASTGSVAAGVAGSIVAPIISQARRHVNILLLLLATATTYLLSRVGLQSLLWPGARADGAYSQNPLPEGSMGCPLVGCPGLFTGTKEEGPFAGLQKLGGRFGNVFKSYSFGVPVVSISGMGNIRSALKSEFRPDGINTELIGEKNLGEIIGSEGILYESDNEKHNLLRRLAGNAMTASAIGAAIPSIQEAASKQVDNVLEADTIKMEGVFDEYTLDIAWKQILGLDLTDDEVPEFHRNVETWTSGMSDMHLLLPFRIPGLMTLTKVGRATSYLFSKVEEKLARLDEDGPDSSSLSKLYFATDDDGTTKLTRTQVIHNALLLIIAGSETSSSTLTNAALMLALHPNAWEKIKEEQRNVRAAHGEELSQKALDSCRYLDAVIRETLRIRPLESMESRKVSGTLVVDGKQVPKGWTALLNIRQTHARDPVVYKEDMSHMDIKKGFQPERWLDESTKPSEWLPFGEGRRRCIGERLAMTEMKVILSMLARRVDRFELVGDADAIRWRDDVFMFRPLDGVEVRAFGAV